MHAKSIASAIPLLLIGSAVGAAELRTFQLPSERYPAPYYAPQAQRPPPVTPSEPAPPPPAAQPQVTQKRLDTRRWLDKLKSQDLRIQQLLRRLDEPQAGGSGVSR